MNANAYDEDVRACLDAGMNAHIAKPFQPDALLKLLCELIE
ncbi:MAG: response regulator [Eubacterium sp.]|nr:response regulator [Eubacterium sp.]MBQ6364376.1 response regulator [Lachnospiraceae bacterium]